MSLNQHKIDKAQYLLKQAGLCGWLLYDFQKRNTIATSFLALPDQAHLTRRMFYWIPQKGMPIKIVHAIESHFLDEWPGDKRTYASWTSLQDQLRSTLQSQTKIAMEFSSQGNIPYVSFVDAGTIDCIRSYGCEITSSADIAQSFTCQLSSYQKQTHLDAAHFLDQAAQNVWGFISDHLQKEDPLSEYDVQQYIKGLYSSAGFISSADPICAVNEHSSDPHYSPEKGKCSWIKKGDFILIDLWCKKNQESAVYADISRVAVAARSPNIRQKEIFSIVRKAQKNTADFIRDSFQGKMVVTGAQADRVARSTIEQSGYGEFFIHRTGHNIFTQSHGPGTHLDSYETQDERALIANSCFSIEPGIYLPNEFGVRLEYNVLINDEASITISGGEQNEIVCLL